MYQYPTLVSALEDLQKRGFVHDFSVNGSSIECEEMFTVLEPGQYEVAERYSFSDLSSTSRRRKAEVYAIRSVVGLKGIAISLDGKNQLVHQAVQEPALQA